MKAFIAVHPVLGVEQKKNGLGALMNQGDLPLSDVLLNGSMSAPFSGFGAKTSFSNGRKILIFPLNSLRDVGSGSDLEGNLGISNIIRRSAELCSNETIAMTVRRQNERTLALLGSTDLPGRP
jgi:hypothetical protein